MKYFLSSIFIISTVFGFSQDKDIPSAVKKALEHMDTNIIRSGIACLSDDKLKGRQPGTEGYQLAMDYILAQYKKTGLQPAGEHNSYLQEVNLRKAFLDTSSIKILWKDANGIIPGLDMLKFVKEWREKYYHKTADGMDGLFNFTSAKTYVQLNFLVSYSIVQSDEKPQWNNGDLFGL